MDNCGIFWCKVTGDKGAHCPLQAGISGCTVPALLPVLDEENTCKFWDITETSKGLGEYVLDLWSDFFLHPP